MFERGYKAATVLVGIAAFLGSWGYAVAEFGWLLGLGLGWFPALFVGTVLATIWPLALVGLLVALLVR